MGLGVKGVLVRIKMFRGRGLACDIVVSESVFLVLFCGGMRMPP